MSHLELITSEKMLNRFEKMCSERPDLQTLSYVLGPNKIPEWIHSIGVCIDDELKTLIPPIPPLELRSIVAAPEAEIFLWTGAVDMEQFINLYETHKSSGDPQQPSILDFGCGCGRMSRFLDNRTKCYAADINPELVNWCRDNLTGVQTYVNNQKPPLPFNDQSFNFIYSLSVFTHLPENVANLWLAEIHRVLAPNGILIFTTHGIPALNTIKDSKIHLDMFRMKSEDVADILLHFKDNPFMFMKYSSDVIDMAKSGEEYGNSFIHRNFIENNWNNEYFKVLNVLEGGLRGWQDIAILQRR